MKKFRDHLKEEETEFAEIRLKVRDVDSTMLNLLKYIQTIGNSGHSFNIVVDPTKLESKDGEYQKSFFWDGDGSNRIESVEIEKVSENQDSKASNYMFFENLKEMKRKIEELLNLDVKEIDDALNNGHDWANDHISKAAEDISQVFDFFKNFSSKKQSKKLFESSDKFEKS